MNFGICTIISKNYISFARTLIESYLKHHPDGKAFVLVTDQLGNEIIPKNEKFNLIQLKDLQIPNVESLCFKYNITELNTAVKPFFMEYLLKKYQLGKLIYFDPDIYIFQNLKRIFDLLTENSIVLTPHLLSPIKEDNLRPSEQDILKAGAYNLGFIGLSNSAVAAKFLIWWKERLYKHCFIRLESGLFVDQKWVDLVPGMFDTTYILRDIIYNAAYWNLHERKITHKNGEFYVNGQILGFYHFSGFDISLKKISKHQTRHHFNQNPDLLKLFHFYKSNLEKNGFHMTINLKYSHDYFDNKIKIPPIVREIYKREISANTSFFKNPFVSHPPNSFFNWLTRPMTKSPKIPRLLHEIYNIRSDLKTKLPGGLKKNRKLLANWGLKSLAKEYGISHDFLKRLM